MSVTERVLGLIGGTGLDRLGEGQELELRDTSPWGKAAAGFTQFELEGTKLLFLPRHGYDHRFAPHRINYRANIMAFKNAGVSNVLAVNAVGSTMDEMSPGSLVLADQIIDYTWGRAHTYYEDDLQEPEHIDFAQPFSDKFRTKVIQAAEAANIVLIDKAVLGVTQGPRLETAAEVKKLKRDGCDLIGMTTMPEASLAREAGIAYASLCVVGNMGAGLVEGSTIDGMDEVLHIAMQQVRLLVKELAKQV